MYQKDSANGRVTKEAENGQLDQALNSIIGKILASLEKVKEKLNIPG